MKNYDFIVIGSGPAGEKAAAQAAYFGKTVALVEKEPALGGAGVNTGTIPSKTLRESAIHLSGLKQRGLYGVNVSMKSDISVSDFMYHERTVVEKAWELIDDNMSRHGVDVYRGMGTFSGPHEVSVNLGSSHVVLTGKNILIATGSSPLHPESIPFDGRYIYDSDTILSLDRIPKSLAVVGAGVIGCEYACMLAALGIDVSGEVEVESKDLLGLRVNVLVQPEEREDPVTGQRQVRMRVPYLGYEPLVDGPRPEITGSAEPDVDGWDDGDDSDDHDSTGGRTTGSNGTAGSQATTGAHDTGGRNGRANLSDGAPF